MTVAEKAQPRVEAASQVAEKHNPKRWSNFWKRATQLGFGGGIILLIAGAIISSAGLAGFGFLGGLTLGAIGMVGQGLTKK